MKRYILLVNVVILSAVLFSVEKSYSLTPDEAIFFNQDIPVSDEIPAPKVFLGLSTGLNHGGLFALTGEFHIANKAALAASVGLGTWGYKLGADLKFYQNYAQGLFFVVGISQATGVPQPIDITITSNNTTEVYPITFLKVANLNPGIGYAWKVGRRARFMLDLGYSIKISQGEGYRVENRKTLNDVGKTTMAMMRPGGLRFGLGFNFGL
jgi:hypothetical protein